MASITINIPNEHVDRVLDAFLGTFPIPQIPNPDYHANPSMWDNPSDPPPQYINEYTNAEWGRMKIMDWIKQIVKNYERRAAARDAADAVSIPGDMVQ